MLWIYIFSLINYLLFISVVPHNIRFMVQMVAKQPYTTLDKDLFSSTKTGYGRKNA